MSGPPDFDALYASTRDPWRLATSAHEHRKYARTLEALEGRRFARAFEPGCSIGVLTALLVGSCEELVASDTAVRAVEQARLRAPGADVRVGTVPRDWPTGSFDLVLLSELLYYLPADDRAAVLDRTVDSLRPEGLVVLAHWRHPFEESHADGDACHREAFEHPRLHHARHVDDPDHLIDAFTTGADGGGRLPS